MHVHVADAWCIFSFTDAYLCAARGLSSKYDACAHDLSVAAQVPDCCRLPCATARGGGGAFVQNHVCDDSGITFLQLNGELQAAVARGDDESRELLQQVCYSLSCL